MPYMVTPIAERLTILLGEIQAVRAIYQIERIDNARAVLVLPESPDEQRLQMDTFTVMELYQNTVAADRGTPGEVLVSLCKTALGTERGELLIAEFRMQKDIGKFTVDDTVAHIAIAMQATVDHEPGELVLTLDETEVKRQQELFEGTKRLDSLVLAQLQDILLGDLRIIARTEESDDQFCLRVEQITTRMVAAISTVFSDG